MPTIYHWNRAAGPFSAAFIVPASNFGGLESTQDPFYRLLGSKKDQKKRLLYETGHIIPRNELIKETLNWLDQYLGPVN